MNQKLLFLVACLASLSLLTLGCATQPRVTTPPQDTPTESVIVIVVTATPPPSIPATQTPTESGEPTITPIATLTPIGGGGEEPARTDTPQATTVVLSVPTAIVIRATATLNPKATATRVASATATRTTAAPPPTTSLPPPPAISSQNKYPAPEAIFPQAQSFNDGQDLKFQFRPVGPFATNECYLVHVDMVNQNLASNNVRGDDFLEPNTSHCGDQSNAGTTLSFVVFRSKFTSSPNYGTIRDQALALTPNDPPRTLGLNWYVRVVQNNGPSGDGVHYKIVGLSPASAVLSNTFIP